MFRAINTKLLLVIAFFLASVAGLVSYQNAKIAQREAQEAKARAEEVKAQQLLQDAVKHDSHNWGGSAETIRQYRPK
jgi:CHASE3 domain sensor protein